jgi:hypothetical protein
LPRSLTENLEQTFRRATHVARYILIAYINARDIYPELIFEYVPEGSKVLYGQSHLSVVDVTRDRITGLIRRFAQEAKGAITTALQCFETGKIFDNVIVLKEECTKAFRSCHICTDLVLAVDVLNSKYIEGTRITKVASLKASLSNAVLSGQTYDEVIFLLSELFPKALKLLYDSISIHDYIISNFDRLKNKARKGKGTYVLFRVYHVALDEIGAKPEDLELVISTSLVKYKVPLEKLYKAVERAYWRYISNLYTQKKKVVKFVSLQDILDLVENELKKEGYLLPPLSELFSELKEIEALDASRHGRYRIHIGLPSYRGPNYPIPIRFYKPVSVDLNEIEQMGLPLNVLKQEWELD